MGEIEGKKEVQKACCCCMCEKIWTAVAAAQFGVHAIYVCAIQQQLIDAYCIVCRSEQAI